MSLGRKEKQRTLTKENREGSSLPVVLVSRVMHVGRRKYFLQYAEETVRIPRKKVGGGARREGCI